MESQDVSLTLGTSLSTLRVHQDGVDGSDAWDPRVAFEAGAVLELKLSSFSVVFVPAGGGRGSGIGPTGGLAWQFTTVDFPVGARKALPIGRYGFVEGTVATGPSVEVSCTIFGEAPDVKGPKLPCDRLGVRTRRLDWIVTSGIAIGYGRLAMGVFRRLGLRDVDLSEAMEAKRRWWSIVLEARILE